ncbi:MAG: hypothetical protein JWM93_778 [Frankiales bacterium]|nr:hypothetical protein [Frankiales bacterium]
MKFLVLYNSTVSAADQMANSTLDQAQAGIDAWMTWASAAGQAVVDLGVPLQAGRKITATEITDSTNQASGYSILEADSLDHVCDLLVKHPHLEMPGSSIEVFEMLSMPGM